MTKITERLERQNDEDIIYIGGVIERTYFGQFGEILNAIIRGLITDGLTRHESNPTDRAPLSAERILGRLEGYQRVISELETAIERKNELERPIPDEEEEEPSTTGY